MEFAGDSVGCLSITSRNMTYTFTKGALHPDSACLSKLRELFNNPANIFFGWGIANDMTHFGRLGLCKAYVIDLQQECRRRRIDVMNLDNQFAMMFDMSSMMPEDHRPTEYDAMMRTCSIDSWKTYLIGLAVPDFIYQQELMLELQAEYCDKDDTCTIHSSQIGSPSFTIEKMSIQNALNENYYQQTSCKETVKRKFNRLMDLDVNVQKTAQLFEWIKSYDVTAALVKHNAMDVDLNLQEPNDCSYMFSSKDHCQIWNELKQKKCVSDLTFDEYVTDAGPKCYVAKGDADDIYFTTTRRVSKKNAKLEATALALMILSATGSICNFWDCHDVIRKLKAEIGGLPFIMFK